MQTRNPIASCCTRPRFNEVGGVDDRGRPDRTPGFAVAGIVAAVAAVYVGTLLLHSN